MIEKNNRVRIRYCLKIEKHKGQATPNYYLEYPVFSPRILRISKSQSVSDPKPYPAISNSRGFLFLNLTPQVFPE